MTRVFVLADSMPWAESLAALIADDERLEVVGASSEGDLHSSWIEDSKPDVMLVSRVALKRLPRMSVPVVLLTTDADRNWELSGNVKAHLPVEVTPGEVAGALLAAAQGLTVLTAGQAESVLHVTPVDDEDGELLVERLTRRETEVLRMMGHGAPNKDIADELHISENTVKFHVASILGKLHAASRTEAVARGLRRGLIPI